MNGGVLFQLAEDCRSPQILAGGGMRWINRVAPGSSITFVNQLGHGNFGKIRIAQKLRPVEEGTPEGFHRKMYGRSRPASRLTQIVAFENVQGFDHRNPAR